SIRPFFVVERYASTIVACSDHLQRSTPFLSMVDFTPAGTLRGSFLPLWSADCARTAASASTSRKFMMTGLVPCDCLPMCWVSVVEGYSAFATTSFFFFFFFFLGASFDVAAKRPSM